MCDDNHNYEKEKIPLKYGVCGGGGKSLLYKFPMYAIIYKSKFINELDGKSLRRRDSGAVRSNIEVGNGTVYYQGRQSACR